MALGVTVTHADGSTSRWGWDEPLAQNVPTGVTFSTSIPGGFKDATMTLARRIDRDYPDVSLYDTVRVYGPANETIWEGRVVQIPRSHADSTTHTIGCVGWAAHLKDNPNFRDVFVDRDLSHWIPASAANKIALYAGATLVINDPTIVPDTTTGIPALQLTCQGTGTSIFMRGEAWYDAGGGVGIGSIYYDMASQGTVAADSAVIASADDDLGTNKSSSADLLTAINGTAVGTHTPSPTTYRFARANYVTTSAVEADHQLSWRRLAIFGNHGLTKQGTAPTDGYYASDIVANIVSRAAPLLKYTTGPSGSITPTTFVVPQLEFRDPVTAEDAILRLNAYHLWEWGVYGGDNDLSGWPSKTFFFRPADSTRLCWEARLSEGAHLDLEGDQGDTVYNGVIVTYNDVAGVSHTVGPPGSGTDATDSTLADTSSSNPVNAHGIPSRYAKLDLSPVTTLSGATQIGAVFLAEQSLPQRRGVLTVQGKLTHPTRGLRPGYEVRAGDFVRISDHPTDVPRRIIETTYDDASTTITMSLDNSVFKLDAILERMGVAIGLAPDGSTTSGGRGTGGASSTIHHTIFG